MTIHSEGKENGKTFYETRYLHYDSLGSVDTITGQQGIAVQRMAYKPFGEQIEVASTLKRDVTNRGYTGHEHIEGTGLIHMNARVYDPTIGRFLSADTIIQDPYDTQSFNRYSYVRNNPMKYTDPTGHLFSGIAKWVSKNQSQIITIVAVGAVFALTGGTGLAGADLLFQGAAMGFTGGFVGTVTNGGSFADGLRNGMIGGVSGAVMAGFSNMIGTFNWFPRCTWESIRE